MAAPQVSAVRADGAARVDRVAGADEVAGADMVAGADGDVETLDGSALPRVMAALAWLPRLLLLHLAWVLLVLAGVVIGGILPATTTLVAYLHGDPELAGQADARATCKAVLRRFRSELGDAHRAAGPFWLITMAAGANVLAGIAGALPAWFFPGGLIAASVLLVVGVLASFHAISLHVLRPDAPAPVIWRGALAGIVLLPFATVSWAVTLTAAVLAAVIIQPIGLLLGGGILVAVTTLVLVRTWQERLEASLAASER